MSKTLNLKDFSMQPPHAKVRRCTEEDVFHCAGSKSQGALVQGFIRVDFVQVIVLYTKTFSWN